LKTKEDESEDSIIHSLRQKKFKRETMEDQTSKENQSNKLPFTHIKLLNVAILIRVSLSALSWWRNLMFRFSFSWHFFFLSALSSKSELESFS